jgi:hypothetical protein
MRPTETLVEIRRDSQSTNGGAEVNKRRVRSSAVVGLALVLVGTLLLAGCSSTAAAARVGELRTESRTIELGDARSVRVEINMGAGGLTLRGGAAGLLEADFVYNVDRLKPAVTYTNGRLVLHQPDSGGLPNLIGIADFRNEWDLRLNDGVPVDLKVDMGAGDSNLQLSGLSLTGLDAKLGAGDYTIDLSGDWAQNMNALIDAGASSVKLRLPRNVGARVEVEDGPHTIDAPGLTKNGRFYTNAAYGVSDVTLDIDLQVGVGQIYLSVDPAAAP